MFVNGVFSVFVDPWEITDMNNDINKVVVQALLCGHNKKIIVIVKIKEIRNYTLN